LSTVTKILSLKK